MRYFICYTKDTFSKVYGSDEVVKYEGKDVMFLELNEEHSKEPRGKLLSHMRYDEDIFHLDEVSKEEFEKRVSNSVGAAIYRDY